MMYDTHGKCDHSSLIEHYAPLVKRLACHMIARLPPSVELDDLVQNGMMGLLNAIDRYEDGMGAQFETYATQRIRGAMLDGLRGEDWLPRNLRRELRRAENVIRAEEQRLSRPPSEGEISAAMGLSLTDYQNLMLEARGHQLVHLEDFATDDGEPYLERHFGDQADPLSFLEDEDTHRVLVQAIELLPEREQLVMSLYYDQELNLREIGEVLGITESRVCQLHGQAIARLRSRVHGGGSDAPRKRGRPRKHPE